jgi:hypothetical protein
MFSCHVCAPPECALPQAVLLAPSILVPVFCVVAFRGSQMALLIDASDFDSVEPELR